MAWNEVDGKLELVVTKPDFAQAIGFVNRVAEVAEELDHHPDIDIRYTTVTLRAWTHTTGGISDKDRQLATRIDAIVD